MNEYRSLGKKNPLCCLVLSLTAYNLANLQFVLDVHILTAILPKLEESRQFRRYKKSLESVASVILRRYLFIYPLSFTFCIY